jgi:hypothetical protein
MPTFGVGLWHRCRVRLAARDCRPTAVGWSPVGGKFVPILVREGAMSRYGVTWPGRHLTIENMKPELTSNVTISPEVLFQEVGGEAVLLDLASETYFGLDDVGTRIWQLLQENGELVAIRDRMLEEYEVEAARLEEDLLSHIERLAEAGLVTIETRDHATIS